MKRVEQLGDEHTESNGLTESVPSSISPTSSVGWVYCKAQGRVYRDPRFQPKAFNRKQPPLPQSGVEGVCLL